MLTQVLCSSFGRSVSVQDRHRFLSSTANDFKNLFSHQSILRPNGRYDFREKRIASFIRHVEFCSKTACPVFVGYFQILRNNWRLK